MSRAARHIEGSEAFGDREVGVLRNVSVRPEPNDVLRQAGRSTTRQPAGAGVVQRRSLHWVPFAGPDAATLRSVDNDRAVPEANSVARMRLSLRGSR